METAVYLFTGFLEAGKTKFITDTMQDEGFNDGERKYLVITCEEGEEEITPDLFGPNVSFASFDDEQKITPHCFLKSSDTRISMLLCFQRLAACFATQVSLSSQLSA